MPEPGEYTPEALLLFPIVVSLNVPFKSEERIIEGKGYKADFLIMNRLIVEVDGEAHSTLNRSRKDARRDSETQDEDFHVLRLTNDDVINNPEKCKREIQEAIEKLPKVPYCLFSNSPHHHVEMTMGVWCMSKRRYLP